MKKTLTLGLMMLGLFTANVQAETSYCHTLEDCQKLKTKVEADLKVLLSYVTPELTEILKTGVSQRQAEEICENKGMRLPTARELARLAQGRGAEGISTTRKAAHYNLIKGSDIGGHPDYFFFSSKGHESPAGDLGSKSLWSSSTLTSSVSGFKLDALSLNSNGSLVRAYRDNGHEIHAVRCVESR